MSPITDTQSLTLPITINYQGATTLELSCTGLYLSVLYNDFQYYFIIELTNNKVIEEGHCKQIVWHSHSNTYALLQLKSVPIQQQQQIDTDTLRRNAKGKKKKENVTTLYEVNVKQIDFSGEIITIKSDLKTVYLVQKIYGGYLLALVNKHVTSLGNNGAIDEYQVTSNAGNNNSNVTSIQLFDWNTLLPIGDELPTPYSILYDTTFVNFCAFLYSNFTAFFSLKYYFLFILFSLIFSF